LLISPKEAAKQAGLKQASIKNIKVITATALLFCNTLSPFVF
jgi:hypothetical protein